MADIHWKTATSAAFGDAADWSTGAAPGTADNAILDATGAAFTVTAAHNHTVASIQTAANATLAIRGAAFTATNGTGAGANAGTISVSGAASLRIGGVMDNSGAIDLRSTAGATAAIIIETNTTLRGGGVVNLNDSLPNAIVGPVSGTATLTNFNNIISGAGQIGGVGLNLVNEAAGVIDADGASQPIIIFAEHTTNAGLIEATGQGHLFLQSAVLNRGSITQSGGGFLDIEASVTNTGLISAEDLVLRAATIDDSKGGVVAPLSQVTLSDGVVLGGNLSVSAGGTVTVAGYSNALKTTTLTNAGAIDILGDLQMQNTIVNSGGIDLEGSDNRSAFLFLGQSQGSVVLTGGGTINLSDNSHNYIYSTRGSPAPTIVNSDNTISGAGTIGDYNSNILNMQHGVIDATGTNALVLGHTNSAFFNAGLIEATGQGGLTIDTNVYNRGTLEGAGPGALTIYGVITNVSEGVIATTPTGSLVLDGGINDTKGGVIAPLHHFTLQGGRVTGGNLTIASGGTMTVLGRFNGLVTSTLSNAGDIVVGAFADLQIQNAIVNSGRISIIGRAGAAATLFLGGDTTLSGGGQVVLGDDRGNQIVAGSGRTVTLINTNDTISGSGSITSGLGAGVLSIRNETLGVIDGDGRAASLVIGSSLTSGSLVNAGLIEATGAAGLKIECAAANTGKIEALGTGTLDIAGALTGGGSMQAGAGATLEADAAVASTQSMTFSGANAVLALGDPSAFKATINGFAPTDAIALVGFKATAATLNASDQLVITNGATPVATLQLAGDYAGDTFTVTFNGGLTRITVSGGATAQPPAGSHAFVAAMAAMERPDAMASATLGHSGFEAPPRLISPRAQTA